MARPKGIPSLTRHVSGRAVVRLDGKDHYCGAWDDRRGRPSPEARAAYQRLLAERAAGATIEGPLETVGELAAAYWPHVRSTYRKRGSETSEGILIVRRRDYDGSTNYGDTIHDHHATYTTDVLHGQTKRRPGHGTRRIPPGH